MTYPVEFMDHLSSAQVSVDFLRLTVPNMEVSERWFELGKQARHYDLDRGDKLKSYRLKLMDGVQTEHWAYAKNETHHLVEFRGELAERMYYKYTTEKGKCTRIDLAITCFLDVDLPNVALVLHEIATQHMRRFERGSGRKMPVITGGDDGYTCYLGSRSSDSYFRCYDKMRRDGVEKWKNAWRFEIELKGDRAAFAWRVIQQGTEAHEVAKDLIKSFLERYNIDAPFIEVSIPHVTMPRKSNPKDVEARLDWLRKQVRPSVLDLVKRGFLNEVLDALELVGEIEV